MADKGVAAKITNPLTLIAVFAGLAETAGTLVLPKLDKTLQEVFIWYVMLFPTVLVVTFFLILCIKREILYAPKDFENPEHFMQLTQKTGFAATTIDESELIKHFIESPANFQKVAEWMRQNSLEVESITYFMTGKEYTEHRKRMIHDLDLQQTVKETL